MDFFSVGGNLYLADFGFAIMTFSSGFYGYLLATVCFHVISSRLYGFIPLTIKLNRFFFAREVVYIHDVYKCMENNYLSIMIIFV